MTDKGTSGQSVQKSPELPEGPFLMDGIEGLRSLPRHSVDMLLTDPPYGTTRNFWDVPLPLPELWEAVKWAVKPDGAVLFFAQCPYDKVLGASNLSMLRYEWVWYKSRCTGFLNARRAPLKKTENILVFYQKLPLYNPQFEQGKPYKKIAGNNGNSTNYGKVTRSGSGSVDCALDGWKGQHVSGKAQAVLRAARGADEFSIVGAVPVVCQAPLIGLALFKLRVVERELLIEYQDVLRLF